MVQRKEERMALQDVSKIKLILLSPQNDNGPCSPQAILEDVLVLDRSTHGMGCQISGGTILPKVADIVEDSGVKKYEVRWLTQPEAHVARFGLKLKSLSL